MSHTNDGRMLFGTSYSEHDSNLCLNVLPIARSHCVPKEMCSSPCISQRQLPLQVIPDSMKESRAWMESWGQDGEEGIRFNEYRGRGYLRLALSNNVHNLHLHTLRLKLALQNQPRRSYSKTNSKMRDKSL